MTEDDGDRGDGVVRLVKLRPTMAPAEHRDLRVGVGSGALIFRARPWRSFASPPGLRP
jgi:hypothetical protein